MYKFWITIFNFLSEKKPQKPKKSIFGRTAQCREAYFQLHNILQNTYCNKKQSLLLFLRRQCPDKTRCFTSIIRGAALTGQKKKNNQQKL